MQFPEQKTEMVHLAVGYDSAKAHAYYERTKKLKGRKKGQAQPSGGIGSSLARIGGAQVKPGAAKAAARRKVAEQVYNLQQRLNKLQAELKKRMAAEASDARKSKAEKTKSAKDAAKPETAAEKRDAAKASKKYRDKNQQKVAAKESKTADKGSGGSGGQSGKGSKPEAPKTSSVADLKVTISKVKTQLTAAKARQRALR